MIRPEYYEKSHGPTRNCLVCRRMIRQPRVGRPRRTCSDACRQRLHRARWEIYHPDERRWKADKARADRLLARYRRQYGDLGPDAWRMRVRLSRGIPLQYCHECGKPFIGDSGFGRLRRYCSVTCQNRARRRHEAVHRAVYQRLYAPYLSERVLDSIRRDEVFLICARCQIPFVRDQPRGRAPKYCSKACRQAAHWRRDHRPVLGWATCPGCDRRFQVRDRKQRYCSRRCRHRLESQAYRAAHAKTHFYGTCAVCGVRLEKNPRHRGPQQQYCSGRCRQRAVRSRAKQRREMARGRQVRRCLWCGQALGWQAHGLCRYCSAACRLNMKRQRQRLQSLSPRS